MLFLRSAPATHYADVVRVLTARHVKLRSRGSALGIAWSLLNPAIMALVYTAVFGHQFASYYGNSSLEYLAAVFIGLVINGFFATSTAQSLRAVVDSGTLINKICTPASVFPMSLMLSACVQLVVGALPAFAAIAIATKSSILGFILLAVPLCSLVMLAFGTSFLLSAIYVFFRDIPYMYELVLFATWVAAPVFYPLAIVGQRYQQVIRLNPLTQIMESIRDIILRHTLPGAFAILEPLAIGAALCVLGWFVFRALSPRFMDYL